MKVGIIGHGQDKFTPETEKKCKEEIEKVLSDSAKEYSIIVISGRSPMGGVDIWAEEIAEKLGFKTMIFPAKVNQWNPVNGYGFKARNLDIAKTSDEVHIFVVVEYPEKYSGMRFKHCYHCGGKLGLTHVKSGACWTGAQALRMGKKVHWHYVPGISLLCLLCPNRT